MQHEVQVKEGDRTLRGCSPEAETRPRSRDAEGKMIATMRSLSSRRSSIGKAEAEQRENKGGQKVKLTSRPEVGWMPGANAYQDPKGNVQHERCAARAGWSTTGLPHEGGMLISDIESIETRARAPLLIQLSAASRCVRKFGRASNNANVT